MVMSDTESAQTDSQIHMGAYEGVDPWAALLYGLNAWARVGQESGWPDLPQNVPVVPSPSSLKS